MSSLLMGFYRMCEITLAKLIKVEKVLLNSKIDLTFGERCGKKPAAPLSEAVSFKIINNNYGLNEGT